MRKYSRGLDFFRAFDNGMKDVNTIVDYLVNLEAGTAQKEIEEKIKKIQEIYKTSEYQIFKEIEARDNEFKADKNAEKQKFSDQARTINYQKQRSKWYVEHKGIPQNIVDMGNFIKTCRNGPEHYNDSGTTDNSNLDLTAFTLWAQIMALLEVARYFAEKDQ